MMIFAVVILTLFTMDTARTIRHRIIAQNAADAAADVAALWQARGCNLLQHLNNAHYTMNEAFFIAEAGELVSCTAAPILALIPYVGSALSQAACAICKLAPGTDDLQKTLADAIVAAQDVIAEMFPILVFAHASAAAKGCEADKFFDALGGYANNLANMLGIDLPVIEDIGGLLGSISGDLVYAMPLDITSLDLNVEKKDADDLPYEWNFTFEYVAVGIGQGYCGMSSPSGDNDWGWDDEYYWGNPGFMTWLAGKKSYGQGAGLGSMIWFHGQQQDMETQGRVMYDQTYTAGSELRIPAVMGIASSHIEGEPVVSEGDANATPKLITVHLPPADNPTAVDDYLIYH